LVRIDARNFELSR